MREIAAIMAYWAVLAGFVGWAVFHLWINEPLTAALLGYGAYLQWKKGSDYEHEG